MAKLANMGRSGIKTFSRQLKYRNQTIILSDGSKTAILVGNEKGIDVRLALDIVSAIRKNTCDIALIFSQDQDLSEVAEEAREIARQQGRWFKMACAFPISPTYNNRRGIDKTDWVRFDRKVYDSCLDPRDYRPKDQKR